MEELEEVLKRIYYDPKNIGGYGGIDRLYKEARKEVPGLKLSQVKSWLKGEPTYTLFKPRRKKFKRLKILFDDIDGQWQADLLDMSWIAADNDQHKFLLVVIDVLSKYAWAVPLKTKSAQIVVDAFKSVLEQGRVPKKLQTDQGKEFKNKLFERLMRSYGINFFTSTDTVKCAIVERFNRTIRERIYRYLYHKNTHRYIDDLQNLVNAYNLSYHRTIGMAPSQVTPDNVQLIKDRNKEEQAPLKKKPIPEGELVRISRWKDTFEKGAESNWTEEVFKVDKRKRTPLGYVYKLVDLGNEPISSLFYSDELNPVKMSEYVNIKILRTRVDRRTNKLQYYVHYIGYPKKFDQWINEEDTIDV